MEMELGLSIPVGTNAPTAIEPLPVAEYDRCLPSKHQFNAFKHNEVYHIGVHATHTLYLEDSLPSRESTYLVSRIVFGELLHQILFFLVGFLVDKIRQQNST